jgi:Cellulase (glycosyl hydrolase family 5)
MVSLAAVILRASSAQISGAVVSHPVSGWTTRGPSIVAASGATFVIAGISWYGLETPQHVLYGLDARDYKAILEEARAYGYNTVRISYSNVMWETDPLPNPLLVHACAACQGKHARDILALVINYAGAIGLHVILDNHRSDAGSSTASNGLWYDTDNGLPYTERGWIQDWIDIQHWLHGRLARGGPDTVVVHDVASDGLPTVMGFDLRNEPHTPPAAPYLQGATWGTGDGIDPNINPNPNPFSPACVATSTCHDWRLAAERAGDSLLGDARRNGWSLPLIFVQGISSYPSATGSAAKGPYDIYRWGGMLDGVNGNARNPGAPIVLNAGGTASRLGPAIANHVVYTTRDYGPDISATDWFTSSTCYRLGCSPRDALTGLVNLWCQRWAYIALPPGRYGTCTGGVNPHFHTAFPWKNTGSTPYTQAPVWIGEFGTGNSPEDLASLARGSQGQWFTDLINFIQSSYGRTPSNNPGISIPPLNWTYWALNTDDPYSLLGEQYRGLANPTKQYSFLCYIIRHPVTRPPQRCGSTGVLPAPR